MTEFNLNRFRRHERDNSEFFAAFRNGSSQSRRPMQIDYDLQVSFVVGATGHLRRISVCRTPQDKFQWPRHIRGNMACIRTHTNIQVEFRSVGCVRTGVGMGGIASQNFSIAQHCHPVALQLSCVKMRIPEAFKLHIFTSPLWVTALPATDSTPMLARMAKCFLGRIAVSSESLRRGRCIRCRTKTHRDAHHRVT